MHKCRARKTYFLEGERSRNLERGNTCPLERALVLLVTQQGKNLVRVVESSVGRLGKEASIPSVSGFLGEGSLPLAMCGSSQDGARMLLDGTY